MILVLFAYVCCSCSQSVSSIPSASIMPSPTNAPESYEGYWLLTESEVEAFEGLEFSGSTVYLYDNFDFINRETGHNVANDYNIMILDGKIYGCGYQDIKECLFEINADGTLTCTIFNYAFSGTHVYAKASTDEIDALIEAHYNPPSSSSNSSDTLPSGEFWCMGKNDTCKNKTYDPYDYYCSSCDPDGDNVEG